MGARRASARGRHSALGSRRLAQSHRRPVRPGASPLPQELLQLRQASRRGLPPDQRHDVEEARADPLTRHRDARRVDQRRRLDAQRLRARAQRRLDRRRRERLDACQHGAPRGDVIRQPGRGQVLLHRRLVVTGRVRRRSTAPARRCRAASSRAA